MALQFRRRLLNRDRLFGCMVTLAAPEVAEILAAAGYDWLFIDAEHAPLDARDVQLLMQGAGLSTPCLVRLAAAEEVAVKKALDAGAAGIIVPMVNSAAQAEQVVAMARYAPLGRRGVGLGRAQGYGLAFRSYLDHANEEVAVIVQAEHVDAVHDMEAIAAVPGVDGVLVGPYDLSASLGLLGQIDHPQVADAIEHVTQVCWKAGLALGIFGVSAAAVRPYLERGYTLIVAGVDTLLLGTAATHLVAELKNRETP